MTPSSATNNRNCPRWQPVEYNALHGGMHRLFAPVLPETVAQPAWHVLGQLESARAALRAGRSA